MKKHLLGSFFYFLFWIPVKGQDLPFHVNAETASYIKDAVYSPLFNHVFFFSGSSVMLYDLASKKTVEPSWYALGNIGDIDASLLWDNNLLLLFSGSHYLLYEMDSARIVSDWVLWPGIPEEWNGEIDAAVRWSNDEVMFFSDTEYLRYSISKNEYVERNKFTHWEGWPAGWENNLTTVLNINTKIYFIRNSEFITVDPVTQKFSNPAAIWTIK